MICAYFIQLAENWLLLNFHSSRIKWLALLLHSKLVSVLLSGAHLSGTLEPIGHSEYKKIYSTFHICSRKVTSLGLAKYCRILAGLLLAESIIVLFLIGAHEAEKSWRYYKYRQGICAKSILAHPHTLRTLAFCSAHSHTTRVRFLKILPHPHPHTSLGPRKQNALYDIHMWC